MKNEYKFIAFITGLFLVCSIISFHAATPFTSAATTPIGGQTYTVAGSGISTTDTSITVTSFTVPQNGYKIQDSDLGDIFYVTIEPGNRTKQEIVSCTTDVQNANNTATFSGCIRGLSPIAPYTASSTLQFSHAGGSQIIFSDPPQLFNLYGAKANNENITGTWTFPSADPSRVGVVTDTDTTNAAAFVTLGQLSRQAVSGASNSSETVKGISQLSTGPQAAAGTSAGSTGARLVLPGSLATSTCQSVQNSVIIASTTTGRIDKGCIDQTLNYSWTGSNTFSAGTTTLAGTTTISGKASGAILSLVTASTTFTGATTPQAFFISTTTGAAVLTDSNNAASSTFAGFIVTSGTNGQTVYAQTDGVVPGFTGLTPGSDYYATSSGSVQNSIGSVREIYVGSAVSATQILINRSRAMQFNGSASASVGNNTYTTVTIPALTRFINITTSGPLADYQLTVDTTNNKTVQVATGVLLSGTSAGAQGFTASSSGSVLGMVSSVSSGGGSAATTIIFYR